MDLGQNSKQVEGKMSGYYACEVLHAANEPLDLPAVVSVLSVPFKSAPWLHDHAK